MKVDLTIQKVEGLGFEPRFSDLGSFQYSSCLSPPRKSSSTEIVFRLVKPRLMVKHMDSNMSEPGFTSYTCVPVTRYSAFGSEWPLEGCFLLPPALDIFKWQQWDLSGGAVVKNPPASAGDTVLSLVGKIPHATEQLSPCATTTEPASHNY